jgi:transcriptional antiterminator RfaH
MGLFGRAADASLLDANEMRTLQFAPGANTLHRKFPLKSRKFNFSKKCPSTKPNFQLSCICLSVKLLVIVSVARTETVVSMRQEPLQIEAGLRWYALRTKVNRERDVGRRLTDLGLEVFLPWMRARRRIGSRFQWVLAPLFPGYVFCRLDMVMSGKAARYSPGVKDFLTFGARIAEVGEDIIQTLRERCPGGIAQIDPVSAKPGDTVRINEGPFSGLEAIFEQFLKGSERVAVLLEILGRQTRLVLPSETIAKV